jgi:glycosyltransferase involved in cell wall biosynthesis
LKDSKHIWLINIGEPLPHEGNSLHRMTSWKTQLEKEGHTITFFTTDFEHQRKQWIKKAPEGFILLSSYIPYKKNVSILRLANHFLLSLSLWKAFTKQPVKANVILVSYPTIWLSLVSIIYGKSKKIKVIVDVRDKWPDIFLFYPGFSFLICPLFLLKKYIFNNANKLIAISPGYYTWALPNKEFDNDYVLPLVKPLTVKIERRLEMGNPIKLVFVGTLGITYNLEMLLKIHDALTEKKILFQIIVCGDGPRQSWLKNSIVERKQIIMLGWLNKKDLQQKLNEANFGLMLYNKDAPQGWPNKLVEYMANGLPIINTLKGESWELIEKEKLGINIHSEKIIVLVNWISDLINNKESYNNYVNRNYFTHNQYFSEKSNLDKLLKLI